jgi:hypothetical protein
VISASDLQKLRRACRPSSAKPELRFNKSVSRFAAALVDAQFWCWGCDVRRKEGNLLLAHGFTRVASEANKSATRYVRTLDCGCTLTLWGWGMVCAPCTGKHGALLRRQGAVLRMVRLEHGQIEAGTAEELVLVDGRHRADIRLSQKLVQTMLGWAADYEAAIAQEMGSAYREAQLGAWPERRKTTGISPSQFSSSWRMLAGVVEMTRGA